MTQQSNTEASSEMKSNDALTAPESKPGLRESAESRLDAVLSAVGLNPPSITDPQGWRHITLGSVSGQIAVIEAGEALFLRIVVSVMDLPSDEELILPLMRELLERNFGLAGSARIAIAGRSVVIALAQPMVEMSETDIRAAIDQAMSAADELDEPLLKRYGGTSRTRV
jgi:hypothetical protein